MVNVRISDAISVRFMSCVSFCCRSDVRRCPAVYAAALRLRIRTPFVWFPVHCRATCGRLDRLKSRISNRLAESGRIVFVALRSPSRLAQEAQ
jgi:hypothetical protein